MKPYFDDIQSAERLRLELQSWLGTPYRHWCGVKGLGADCIHFIVRIGETIGFLPAGVVRIPHYSQKWHFHQDESLLLLHFEGHIQAGTLKVQEICGEEPMNGDIFFFHFGRTISHSAFYCDGYFHHAVTGSGVITSIWTDNAWQKRIKRVYRVIQ